MTHRWLHMLGPALLTGALCLGVASLAHAQEPSSRALRAWSSTGIELTPDLYGDPGVRAVERLGVDLEIDDAVSLQADGALRLQRVPHQPFEGDLYRLVLTGSGTAGDVQVGRLVRLGVRGFQRIDGLSFDVASDGPLSGSFWGGHLWHPVTFQGSTWVAGGQMHWLPLRSGDRVSRTLRLTGGYEARATDEVLHNRFHLAARAFHPRGSRGSAFVEIQPSVEDTEWRGSLRGSLPAGRDVDVGAEVRWEDLRPDTAPVDLNTPIDWLTTEGYGIATASLRWRGGDVSAVGWGGPTVQPGGAEGQRLGGIGRMGVSWTDRDALTLGAFANAAGIAGSWVAGGGAEGTWAAEQLRVEADTGVYAFQGLDGDTAPIWESRIRASLPLLEAERAGIVRHLSVGIQGATGADRQLVPWVRGGMSLHAWVDRGGSR